MQQKGTQKGNMSKMKRKASSIGEAGPSKRRVVSEENDTDDFDVSQRADFEINTNEAETGIVEKVSLKNFMCHSRLDVSLGPHVNFIVGRNGSGKSAVVTALVVGLGGKASITSRGNTIKSFIKTGKQSAELEIKLRNRGPSAYKPQEYGDSIIVERKFTRDGSSQYKIKSKEGKVVSMKREELTSILDQFNIQVDNPVAVLNQDTSRNFLNSKSPHDKYKFFLKATQLDQMKEDYGRANEQREITKEIIYKKEQTLPALEKEVLEWEQKFKSLHALDDLKEKVEKLKDEMAWAFVIAKERELQPMQKEYTVEESRMPKFVQKVEEAKGKVDECTKQHTSIQDKLKATSDEVQVLRPLYDKAKEELMQKKKVARDLQNEVRTLDGRLKKLQKEKTEISSRIKDLRKSAQHDYEAERRAREEKICKLDEQVSALKAQKHTTEHDLEKFRGAVTKLKSDEHQLNSDLNGCRKKEESGRRQLQNLQAAKTDKIKRFGPFIPTLLQHIEEHFRRGDFHQKPRGPLGACFQLRDPQWALAVERCLGTLLHSFCCSDHHDERVLEKIFDRVCSERQRPSIIVSAFKATVYDVSRHRAQSDKFPTVYDVLNVTDPVVANCLIDQRSIENVLLIKKGAEARQVMDPDVLPKPPRNCHEAFTGEGDQVYSTPSLRYYSSMQDRPKFLTANVEEDIQRLQEDLRSSQQEVHRLDQRKMKLLEETRKNQVEENKANTQLMKIGQKISSLNNEIYELRSIEDPAPIDVTTLEEEVDNLSTQINSQQEQREQRHQSFQSAQAEFNSADNAFKDIEQQMRQKAEVGEPLKDDLGHAQMQVEQAKSHRKHYEQKLREQEKKLVETKKKIDTFKKEIDNDTTKAMQICQQRINTRRSVQNLESEVNQINKQIKAEEKSRGNPEEITRKYHEQKEAYRKIKREVVLCKKFIELMMNALENRKKLYMKLRRSLSFRTKLQFIRNIACSKDWNGKLEISHSHETIQIIHLEKVMIHREQQYSEFRKLIAMRAKYFFIVLLSNRKYTGKMTFNHTKETIEMCVQPTTCDGEGAKDMRSLSGGERSFSTVCFILAMWDTMESPFRCLDEFDVFMDMVNRKISMDMMIAVAKNQKHKQFIFLTPQNMSQLGIQLSTLNIFRMPDPDRGQGVLPFEPVRQEDEQE